MEKFLNKISNFISANSLINTDNIVVAFSGGADSAALLDALSLLKEQGSIKINIFAAHINHNLRGSESDGDQQFAKKFAAARSIPIKCISVDVEAYSKDNGVSTETAARQLRRESFCRIAKELNTATIATAHHKNDNAETMIHRLSRGTGIKGLGGIWPKREICINGQTLKYIRPLLCVTRAEIEQYCKDRNIQWRHDSSNDDLIYTRNIIRHDILPGLEAGSSKNICNLLHRLSDSSRRLYKQIEQLAQTAWKECVSIAEKDTVIIEAKAFNALPLQVRQEIIRLAYNRLDGSEGKITQQHYENLIEFATGKDSAKQQLPCEIYCFRGYGKLIFRRIITHGIAFTIIDKPGKYVFKDKQIIVEKAEFCRDDFRKLLKNKPATEEWFDTQEVKMPICVRGRETGDKFRGIGQRISQTVGKFLIGAKIDHAQRAKLFLLEDDNKNIIWLVPHRSSDVTKITEKTKEVYKITISNLK